MRWLITTQGPAIKTIWQGFDMTIEEAQEKLKDLSIENKSPLALWGFQNSAVLEHRVSLLEVWHEENTKEQPC